MNARLGFDLLPDLQALEAPPAVVVQLHVEEPDRSGYVRYVTSRFGNIVDAFSVSSEHLARAVENYDVPGSKIHVIPTGVDAEEEFSPARVAPVDGLGDGFHVLFAGRLAHQKDPLLMTEVAAAPGGAAERREDPRGRRRPARAGDPRPRPQPSASRTRSPSIPPRASSRRGTPRATRC